MIDPKELMIGNVIQCVHEESISIVFVDAYLIKESDHYNRMPDYDCFDRGWHYEPIQISAQVLEACGFDKNRNEWVNDSSEMGFIISQFSDGYAMSEPCKKGVGITSLHLLQNLYFIITGHPLEIDLQRLKTALK